MQPNPQTIFVGDTPQKQIEMPVQGDFVTLLGESFYRIQHFDAMEPFFMSVVSASDHWLFIASTGGLSAGRGSAAHALFPYYTVDKLTENSENTGSKAILLVTRSGRTRLWEPFSDRFRGSYAVQRSLYKNITGTALVFEEVNADLGLTYRYAWRTSERFGFAKTTWLSSSGDTPCHVELIDGLQNVLPAHVEADTQNRLSVLLDAYKRSELDAETGLAVFSLSSTLTDLAEPSESLLATTVFQVGLVDAAYLLSSAQLDRFRAGRGFTPETDVCGRRGAYFVGTTLTLAPDETRTWHLLADVQQDSAAVAHKLHRLRGEHASLLSEIEADIALNQSRVWQIVASADGVQLTHSRAYSAHHFANVLFNVMRGGIFRDQYWVRTSDFVEFVAMHNRQVRQAHADFLAALPDRLHIADLQARVEAQASAALVRLSRAYLPLTFSRRHGDPSRPWNRFSISVKRPDGSERLGYEGNWRDIFQNWEALAYAYPEYVESMITTFLNATTVDGYNPYRITYDGIDWEVPEPGNPWANIGYWSDHQITYLHRLMEVSVKVHPGRLQSLLTRCLFSYAHVPYRIKPYADLLADPYDSIEFDWELERQIEARQRERGADAKLVCAPNGQVLQVSLAEKLLTLLLAKLANFVPEGGIWMNTQRPEWNDANNALVGRGLSVVTLCYLRQYLAFCRRLFAHCDADAVPLSREVGEFCVRVADILRRCQPMLQGSFSPAQRRQLMDELGETGSQFRWQFYRHGLTGETIQASIAEIVALFDLAQAYVDHTLRANQRADHLFHAYNILHLEEGGVSIGHLYEMLEGQVAILSSGMLSGEESLALLQSLRRSALYQPERSTYILYPDRSLPGFLEKNRLTPDQVADVSLFAALAAQQDASLVIRDIEGIYHFSGHIHNVQDVRQALDALKTQPAYAALVEADYQRITTLFEETFRHSEFTGRSGTFFAYEGLGSIYWHMVAKLLLAAQETALRFKDDPTAAALRACYFDIRQGLGFNKTPQEYGAFPTDPYSHSPKGQGAKQPGMTGMVKEVILARLAEIGLRVEDGKLVFDTALMDAHELLTSAAAFTYLDVDGHVREIELPAGSLAFTVCQTPVIFQASDRMGITIREANGAVHELDGPVLDAVTSGHIFRRDGVIDCLTVSMPLAER